MQKLKKKKDTLPQLLLAVSEGRPAEICGD